MYWCAYFLAIIINKHNKNSSLALLVITYKFQGFATAVVFSAVYTMHSFKYKPPFFLCQFWVYLPVYWREHMRACVPMGPNVQDLAHSRKCSRLAWYLF